MDTLLDGYESRFCSSALKKGIHGGFFQRPNWDIIRETAFGKYDVIWIHGYAHPNITPVNSIIRGKALSEGRHSERVPGKRTQASMLRALFRVLAEY
jgi:hypothetical protein